MPGTRIALYVLIIATTASSVAHAKDPRLVTSSVTISPVDCADERPFVLGAVTAAIASKAIGAGISFIAEWFSAIEERQKAQDVASAHGGMFNCLKDGKVGEIVYRRQAVSGSSNGDSSPSNYVGKPDMVFRGELRAIEAEAEDSSKVYKVWVESRELTLNKKMGRARGKIDLSVTVSLEIPSLVVDQKSKTVSSTVHTLDPILFRSIEAGSSFSFPGNISLATGAVTFVKNEGIHPISVKVVVDEVPAGAGSKLIASIYKAIGEGIKEQNDALTAKALETLFGDDDESGEEGDQD